MSSDMMIESWEELLNDQSPAVRSLANDLCFYAILTSGDTKGFNKLAKYIPMSWLMARHEETTEPFTDYIQQALQNIDVNEDLIAENNFMDADFISRDTYDNYMYALNGNFAPSVVISKEENENIANYVSIRNKGSKYNDSTAYNLYKLAGFVNYNTEKRAVYVMLPKRGWHEKNGLDIYEYGDLNFSVNGIPMSQQIIDK